MNRNVRVCIFLVVMLMISSSLPACDLYHPRLIRIISPSPGQIFNEGQTIEIKVSGPGQPGARFEIYINGVAFVRSLVPSGNTNAAYEYRTDIAGRPSGVWIIDLRARLANTTDWRSAEPVCIFIRGTNTNQTPPNDFADCSTVSIVQPDSSGRPSPVPPTLAPVPTTIIQNPTPRQGQPGNGGEGGEPSACKPPPEGCGPYNWDQVTCSCGVP